MTPAPDCAEVKFLINFVEFNSVEEFRQQADLDCGLLCAEDAMQNNHAMHCVKAMMEGIQCQNSWGDSDSFPCIPGNMQGRHWNFYRGYIINLTAVNLKEHGGAVWRHRDPILPVVDTSSAADDGGHELERKVTDATRGKPVLRGIPVHPGCWIAIEDMLKHRLFRKHSYMDIFRIVDADKRRFAWEKDRGVTFIRALKKRTYDLEREAERAAKMGLI
jgi:hypothetical protein